MVRGRRLLPALARVLEACAAAAAAATPSPSSSSVSGAAGGSGGVDAAASEPARWATAYAASMGSLIGTLDALLDGAQARRTRALAAQLDGAHPPLAAACPTLEAKVAALLLAGPHIDCLQTEVAGAFGLRRRPAQQRSETTRMQTASSSADAAQGQGQPHLRTAPVELGGGGDSASSATATTTTTSAVAALEARLAARAAEVDALIAGGSLNSSASGGTNEAGSASTARLPSPPQHAGRSHHAVVPIISPADDRVLAAAGLLSRPHSVSPPTPSKGATTGKAPVLWAGVAEVAGPRRGEGPSATPRAPSANATAASGGGAGGDCGGADSVAVGFLAAFASSGAVQKAAVLPLGVEDSHHMHGRE